MIATARQEVIAGIYVELGFLESNEVLSLVKGKRADELRDIVKDIQFDELDAYMKKAGGLGIEWETFSKEYLLLLMIYVNQSGISDYKIFDSREFFRRKIEKYGNQLERNIARKMKYKELCEMTLEELIGLE